MEGGDLMWVVSTHKRRAPTHKLAWPLNRVILWGHLINWICYISICRRPISTKLRKMVTTMTTVNSSDFIIWCGAIVTQNDMLTARKHHIFLFLLRIFSLLHGVWWNFRGSPLRSEIREIKIPPKQLFQLSHQIKMSQKKPLKTRNGK